MNVLMQQTTKTIIDRCHLQLEGRWYAVVTKENGFKLDY